MERQPEEDHNSKHCKQSINTLFDFSCTHCYFLFADSLIIALTCYNFLCRVRETVLIDNIDHQRNQHRNNSSHKRILETTIEDIQVAVSKNMKICNSLSIQSYTIRKSSQILHGLSRHLIS